TTEMFAVHGLGVDPGLTPSLVGCRCARPPCGSRAGIYITDLCGNVNYRTSIVMRNARPRDRPAGVETPRSTLASLSSAGGSPGPEFPCQSAAGEPFHGQSADIQPLFEVKRALFEAKRRFLPEVRE